jgi:hypothetical protein
MSVTLHHQNILHHIKHCIKDDKVNVKIAVAWFTQKALFDLLLNQLENNVQVDLIILNDTINFKRGGLDFQVFINAGGRLYISTEGKKLHHKFCLIDDQLLCTGSYNWTYQAENNNHENVIVTYNENDINTAITQAFTNARVDAAPIEHLNRFHEMFPPRAVEQEINDYLVEDTVYGVMQEFETDYDIDPKLFQNASAIAFRKLPISLRTAIADQRTAFQQLVTLYHTWSATELRNFNHWLDKSLLLKNQRIIWTAEKVRSADFSEDQLKNLWWHAQFDNLSIILAECSDIMNWRSIVMNKHAIWTPGLLAQYAAQLDMAYFQYGNTSLSWNTELIERFQEHINWHNLSASTNVDWNEMLIDRWCSKFNFRALSQNEAIPWTSDIFERYKALLHLDELSANPKFVGLPKSLSIMKVVGIGLNYSRTKACVGMRS